MTNCFVTVLPIPYPLFDTVALSDYVTSRNLGLYGPCPMVSKIRLGLYCRSNTCQVWQDDKDCEGGGEEEHADRVADLLEYPRGIGVPARPKYGGCLAALMIT